MSTDSEHRVETSSTRYGGSLRAKKAVARHVPRRAPLQSCLESFCLPKPPADVSYFEPHAKFMSYGEVSSQTVTSYARLTVQLQWC